MRVRCHLREIRGRRALRDLAEDARINRGTLSLIERGRLLPADKQIESLERAYGRPIGEWYDWRGPLVPVEMDAAA